MKTILAIIPLLIGTEAIAKSVDHTGLGTASHQLEVNENTVRVELHRLNEMRVFSTGERRNNQGELNHVSLRLDGLDELSFVRWETPDEIFNRTKDNDGGSGYVDIDVNDRLDLFDGDAVDANGNRILKEPIWINARRNSRISVTIDARELDCTGQIVCGRGNTGMIVYEFTIPELPRNLSQFCGGTNSFVGAVVDDMFQFPGMLDYTRTATGRPIIEPSVDELDAFICIRRVVE